MIKLKFSINKILFTTLLFRGGSILARFILSVVIIRWLNLKDFGTFNIFNANLALTSLIIGFEFYNYSIREILAPENKYKQLSLIKDQAVLHLSIYILFFFVASILQAFGLKILYFKYFIALTILENFNQQLFLILITLNRPALSSVFFFVRNALWFFVLLAFYYLNIITAINLNTIFNFWLYSQLLSVILSVTYLFYILKNQRLYKINKKYLISGLKVGLLYLGGSFLYKLLELEDRYLIDFILNKQMVGVFTFFSGIANLIPVLIYNAILVIESPTIIKTKPGKKAKKYYQVLTRKALIWILLGSLSLIIIIFPISKYLKNDLITHYSPIFFLIIISYSFLALQSISNSFLHSFKADKKIQLSIFYTLLINTSISIILIPIIGLYGSVISNLISFSFIYYYKSFLVRKYFIEQKHE